MRNIALAILVVVLPTWVAAAQQSSQPHKNSPKSGTPHPPVRGDSCKKYGPGFVRVEGSGLCVKLGGGVSVEGGGGARR